MLLPKVCVQAVVMAVVVTWSQAATAALVLIANYEFNGTLADSLGNQPDLTSIGSPSFAGGALDIRQPDGLQLLSSLTQSDYRIEVDFTFTQLGRYNKILDFQQRTRDEGLYVNPSNFVTFYSSHGTGTTRVTSGVLHTIGIEKTGGTVTAFLDGVQQFTFSDPVPATSSSNTIVFFADDFLVFGEGAIGSVGGIRLYATAVPAPSAFAVLAIAGIGGILRGCRRGLFGVTRMPANPSNLG